jgi:hypothetical protein
MEQQSYFSVTFLGVHVHFFCNHTNKGAIVLFFILLTMDPDTSSRSLQKLCSSFPIFWLKPLRGMRVLWLIVYRPINFTQDDHFLAIVAAMQTSGIGIFVRLITGCSRGQYCAYFVGAEVSDYWTASSSIWGTHKPRIGWKG